MATYYDIFGQKVQYLASDPSPVVLGQVWYNSTSNTAKIYTNVGAAVSTGGNLNTSLGALGNQTGTQTAALAFSGNALPNTEEYNGTAWTASNAVNLARYSGSAGGTQTATFFGGGSVPAGSPGPGATENYDGTCWTNSGTMGTARKYLDGCGTQTAGLAGGGGYPVPTRTACEAYNGSSWTGLPSLNNGGYGIRITKEGTQTATIAAGGTPRATNTESFDGSSWTNVAAFPGGIGGGGMAGTQADGVYFSGSSPAPAIITTIFDWNNTAWSTSSATAILAKTNMYGSGAATSSIFAAGTNPASPTTGQNTQELTDPSFGTATITVT